MWFTTPDNSFRMSSFKTKIRRRKYALARGNSSAGDKRKDEDCQGAKGVPAEWEFFNFNPLIFGRRGTPSEPPSPEIPGDSCDGSVKRRPTPSPPASRPGSRPPSWLAALPHHFVVEEHEEGTVIRLCFFCRRLYPSDLLSPMFLRALYREMSPFFSLSYVLFTLLGGRRILHLSRLNRSPNC